MLLLGAGAGLAFPSLMTLAMSGATRERLRAWPPAWSTRPLQVGGAIGLAVLATLPPRARTTCWRAATPPAAALTGGYHLAFLIGAGLLVAAIAVAALVLVPESRAEAQVEQLEVGEAEPAYSEAA